ncbi:MAG: sulfatase-like hydrolase/transferase [Planctomycetaceae bacterium]|nr:sulfatase-like hydrolase/transferase [Planctomycetaceae bacterium]
MPICIRVVTGIWILFCASAVSLAQRPNILLIVSDDQRPDTIHALGNEIIRTPHLDQLVRTGTTFTRATCANPICTPSRAEILTGCSGFRMGVRDFGGTIDKTAPRMASWFAGNGYSTWYVGKWHNDGQPKDHGYQQTRGLFTGGGAKFATPQIDFSGRPVTGYRGWIFRDRNGAPQPEKGVGLTGEISRHFAQAAIQAIDDSMALDSPFFVHVNFTSPHDPLMIPPGWSDQYKPEDIPVPSNFLTQHPFDHGNFQGRDEQLFQWPRTLEETQRELAAYYAVISYMDSQIGQIQQHLRDLNLYQETIIVFTSDHGLAIGSHGLRGKQNMYEHTIGVPLIFTGPGIPEGQQSQVQCYLRDLFPTICELAGFEAPVEEIDGRSLKSAVKGSEDQIYPFVTGYFRDSQRMIRTERWKYVEYPIVMKQQLFDLVNDPHERNDLSQAIEYSDTLSDLRNQMTTYFSNFSNGFP